MQQEVQEVPYNDAPDALRRRFAWLQRRATPDAGPVPEESAPELLHDPALNARSFYSSVDGEIASYAAVVRKTITHGDQMFDIAGLSCVATDPDFQARGLGLRTVAAATRWIEQSPVDFGVFTCDPPLASFYARAGAWAVVKDVVLIGSRDVGALRSDLLGKAVLMRLFSAKARAAASTLSHAMIDLDLPVGHFL